LATTPTPLMGTVRRRVAKPAAPPQAQAGSGPRLRDRRPRRRAAVTEQQADQHKKPEKRAKAFRKKPPKAYLERLARAQTQRLCVLKRERSTGRATMSPAVASEPGTGIPAGAAAAAAKEEEEEEEEQGEEPFERFTLCGSTGNVYVVVIRQVPSCTCPDAGKGHQCKHIIYVLHNVLKAPEHLQYQAAFLSSEIQEIFDTSPPPPTENASLDNEDGHRRPVAGECPICFLPLDPDSPTSDILCRTPWAPDLDDISSLLTNATLGPEGYLNIAEALNMSRDR
ncbi:hypothetical protein KEM52_000949, partial [Ascosphaera acerosa]